MVELRMLTFFTLRCQDHVADCILGRLGSPIRASQPIRAPSAQPRLNSETWRLPHIARPMYKLQTARLTKYKNTPLPQGNAPNIFLLFHRTSNSPSSKYIPVSPANPTVARSYPRPPLPHPSTPVI